MTCNEDEFFKGLSKSPYQEKIFFDALFTNDVSYSILMG